MGYSFYRLSFVRNTGEKGDRKRAMMKIYIKYYKGSVAGYVDIFCTTGNDIVIAVYPQAMQQIMAVKMAVMSPACP